MQRAVMPKKTTLPVKEWALRQRINKLLLPQGRTLRRSRPSQRTTFGDYFIMDLANSKGVEHKFIDLEKYGKELGVLKSFEHLEEWECRRNQQSPEYKCSSDAYQRCTNPKISDYKNYGGRGIKFLFESP